MSLGLEVSFEGWVVFELGKAGKKGPFKQYSHFT